MLDLTNKEYEVTSEISFVLFYKDRFGICETNEIVQDADYPLICLGQFREDPRHYKNGTKLKFHGFFVYKREKWELKFDRYEIVEGGLKDQYLNDATMDSFPKTRDGVIRYLKTLKGIGQKSAERLVDAFGTEVIRTLRNNPDIKIIKGVSTAGWKSVKEAVSKEEENDKIQRILMSLDLTEGQIAKIRMEYGEDTMHKISENPYMLADDVKGFGFRTADKIAKAFGISEHDPNRIDAMILYQLGRYEKQKGHVFLNKSELQAFCEKDKLIDAFPEDEMQDSLNRMNERRQVRIDDTRIYLPKNYKYETETAKYIQKAISLDRPAGFPNIDKEIDRYEKDMSRKKEVPFQLDDSQRNAIREIMQHSFSILTGGPGTGKTTILNGIVQIFKRHGKIVDLAAPTGRAAKRMQESTGEPAQTIHRLLEYNGDKFARNHENCLDCDVLVLDECSMIDLWLMYSVLDAVTLRNTRILMVGDKDQLPSVGAGNVLSDLIGCGKIPVVKLNMVHRQGPESDIWEQAYRINNGQMPEPANPGESSCVVYNCNSIEEEAEAVRFLINNGYGNAQVLSMIKKGPAGTNAINNVVQEIKNPQADEKDEIEIGRFEDDKRVYRTGDRIMQTKNIYETALVDKQKNADGTTVYNPSNSTTDVFNGDMGIIEKIDPEEETAIVRMEDEERTDKHGHKYLLERRGLYDKKMLAENTLLAYDITVHKSQGSEFDTVILVLPKFTLFTTRQLIYTGATRAKEKLLILCMMDHMEKMIGNTRENWLNKRNSRLKERICSE